MDRVFRSILFYGLIFLVLIGVVGMFKGQNEQSDELNVKEFMQALDNGDIAEMTMQPKNKIIVVTGELEEGNKPFVVQLPENTDVIAEVTDLANDQSVLKVEQEEQPSAFVNFLTMMLPFLLIAVIFFFLFTRAQGEIGRASCRKECRCRWWLIQ